LRNIASLKDTDFLSLVKAVELAFVSGVGEAFVDELQMERLKEMYEKARELSEGVELPPEEWHKAA
jgi:hypothetical protein